MNISNPKQESLNEELFLYLNTDEDATFPMLRHPLVYGVPYMEHLNCMYNECLKSKTVMINRAVMAEKWENYIFLHERPWRLHAYLEIDAVLSKEQQLKLLRGIWVDSESIYQNLRTWSILFRSLAKKCGHCILSDESMRKLKEHENEDGFLTVYRGTTRQALGKGNNYALNSPVLNVDGLSWTLDPKVAVWFSERYAEHRETNPVVLCAEVARTGAAKELCPAVIGYITQRSEEEVIILPEHIHSMRILTDEEVQHEKSENN